MVNPLLLSGIEWCLLYFTVLSLVTCRLDYRGSIIVLCIWAPTLARTVP